MVYKMRYLIIMNNLEMISYYNHYSCFIDTSLIHLVINILSSNTTGILRIHCFSCWLYTLLVHSIEELLKACSDYFKTTGRRVTFEYSMISGVNDSDENARELAKRLEGTQSHVNLIPVNTVEGTGYLKSNIKRQQAFINILAAKNIGATVRRTLGSDINASCGQLKRKHIEEGGK